VCRLAFEEKRWLVDLAGPSVGSGFQESYPGHLVPGERRTLVGLFVNAPADRFIRAAGCLG
jgi:hypothetical protein